MIMKALAKTYQKESALGKYLYWALEKIEKLINVFGELPQKTWWGEFWSNNYTKTALKK